MDMTPEASRASEAAARMKFRATDTSSNSQTAAEFIDSQLRLEADAREVLPYAFDSCTQPLGPLRQNIFACTTCNPPPASAAQVYAPAGICYSCSIACHGDHTLVELFSRRNFTCDCGSTRMPRNSPCKLRNDSITGTKGVHLQEAAKGNHYNHNFQNRFCGCGEEYNAHEEKGTMFQCLGLGTVETGGCGEDWWHAECLMGLPRDWRNQKGVSPHQPDAEHRDQPRTEIDEVSEDDSTPPGFPDEDDFEALLCYKCVDSNPWIRQYAGAPGFLPPLLRLDERLPLPQVKRDGEEAAEATACTPEGKEITALEESRKRKASEDSESAFSRSSKRTKENSKTENDEDAVPADGSRALQPKQKHDQLSTPPEGTFSLFLKEDFRDHICRCPRCYPDLIPHPQLLEEEEIYQPPVSEAGESGSDAGSGARSHGTGSLLERGEAALSTVDRVRAIEGVMVYNHLKDKVKDFLKPYAESGKAVGAEDIKAYFEKLRGDEAAIREAGTKPSADEDDKENDAGADHRREQSGY